MALADPPLKAELQHLLMTKHMGKICVCVWDGAGIRSASGNYYLYFCNYGLWNYLAQSLLKRKPMEYFYTVNKIPLQSSPCLELVHLL